VASPFGFTVPWSVAAVWPTPVGAPAETVGDEAASASGAQISAATRAAARVNFRITTSRNGLLCSEAFSFTRL
jgi:hypothetical protein